MKLYKCNAALCVTQPEPKATLFESQTEGCNYQPAALCGRVPPSLLYLTPLTAPEVARSTGGVKGRTSRRWAGQDGSYEKGKWLAGDSQTQRK